jgi:hypothetical protein
VSDPNPPKDPQRPVSPDGEQPAVEPQIFADFKKALSESLGISVGREQAADLSTLDDEGIAREGKREAVRRARIENKITNDVAEQSKSRRSVDRREQIILLGLLIFVAFLIAAVVIVGLGEKNDGLARAGLVALASACGAVLYRLRSLDRQ